MSSLLLKTGDSHLLFYTEGVNPLTAGRYTTGDSEDGISIRKSVAKGDLSELGLEAADDDK